MEDQAKKVIDGIIAKAANLEEEVVEETTNEKTAGESSSIDIVKDLNKRAEELKQASEEEPKKEEPKKEEPKKEEPKKEETKDEAKKDETAEKTADEYATTKIEKKDAPKVEGEGPQKDPHSPKEPETQKGEQTTETEFQGPLHVVPKQASEKIIALVGEAIKKHASFLKSVGIPAATAVGGAGLGFLGGKIHEEKKDEEEDKQIARHFLNIGYRAAAEAINNRLKEAGGGNVT